jgi:hypothetical protein
MMTRRLISKTTHGGHECSNRCVGFAQEEEKREKGRRRRPGEGRPACAEGNPPETEMPRDRATEKLCARGGQQPRARAATCKDSRRGSTRRGSSEQWHAER